MDISLPYNFNRSRLHEQSKRLIYATLNDLASLFYDPETLSRLHFIVSCSHYELFRLFQLCLKVVCINSVYVYKNFQNKKRIEKVDVFKMIDNLFNYGCMHFYEHLEGEFCYVWRSIKIINSWGGVHSCCKEGLI